MIISSNHTRNIGKILLSAIIFFLLLFIKITPSRAFDLFFDDFSGALTQWTPAPGDESKWYIDPTEKTLNVYESVSPPTKKFIRIFSNAGSDWDNYLIEGKIKGIEGVDQAILIRVQDADNHYRITFRHTAPLNQAIEVAAMHGGNGVQIGNYLYPYSQGLQHNQWYNVKIKINNFHLEVEIKKETETNWEKVVDIEIEESKRFFSKGRIGLNGWVGGGGIQTIHFVYDDIKVTSISPQPSPFPGLNVPYFSQKDPLWGEHQYDFASQWAPVGKTGIKNWGCTMTSACMVMKYHGINKLPDGGELNPDTVNSWLISQRDGYVNGGLLNWIALTRLAKLSNQTQGSTKLEFVRKSYATDKVRQDLENQKPVILQEPGHFIVVRGQKDGNTWLINDPYTKTRGEVVKTSTFYTANTFRPSSTNLSAIMLIVDPTLDLLITNPEGSRSGKLAGQVFDEIPDVLIAQEGPIVNPEDGSSQSGSANILTFMQPANGEYTIIISSPNTQMVSAKGFVYDQNGEPVEIILSGIASLGNPAEFIIDFSQTEPSIIKPKNVDFDKLIDDINILFKLKEIKNSSFKRLLLNLTRQAEFFTEKDHKWGKRMARHFLSLEMEIIKKQEGKLITSMGASILQEEIKALKESL